MDRDHCPISLHLYPSDRMKSDYSTSNPIIFTVSAIAMFAFTSLVFVFYDYKVERRQEIVMTSAARSTAIVMDIYRKIVYNNVERI